VTSLIFGVSADTKHSISAWLPPLYAYPLIFIDLTVFKNSTPDKRDEDPAEEILSAPQQLRKLK